VAPLFTGFLQRQRLKMVRPYLQGDILDLGCGDASLLAWVSPGQVYVGVDSRAPLVANLKRRFPEHRFYRRDLDRDPLGLPRRFHTIVLLAVIEHLSDPGRVLSQLPASLHPGGRVLMTTPSPIGDRIHQVGARAGLFSREASQEHKIIFTRSVLRDYLWQNGLELNLYRPFLFGGNQLFVCTAR
jgi:2-polyprenyl-3-methyl-5-hydroxy-6-metoxy-1,4-benzoquinol methylase